MAWSLMLAIIEKFAGGPVGIDNLAAALSEQRETIEDVLEPYLIQQGFIMRTPRGRIVTDRAYTVLVMLKAVPKGRKTRYLQKYITCSSKQGLLR